MEEKSYNLFFLLLLTLFFTLISNTLQNIQYATGADEGYYFAYARDIATKGISAFPDLFKSYINNQQHWVYPNPLRIGFILLSSIWLKIFGPYYLSLTFLSLFSLLLFLLISYYFVKKYFGSRIALLFIILMSFSPLNMAMARRALMDATSNLFMAASIWLFLEAVREKRLPKTILFILVYTFTILVKENSVLLSVYFIFYILIRKYLYNKPPRLRDIFSVTIFPFAIVGIIYLIASGDISLVVATARIILNSPKSNQYAILFGSGPWYRYLIDFMLFSPWTCILAIGFSLHYITKKEWQEEVSYLLLLLVSLILLLSFFTKNIRYLIILDMPIRLFAVLMLSELSLRIFKDRAIPILLIAITVIAFLDYFNFYDFFINYSIYDPVTYWLLQVQHIIP